MTDTDGRFHLEHPGAVIRFAKKELQPQALVIKPAPLFPMSDFALHPEAALDLSEIWDYISADNPSAAQRVLDEIHSAIRAWLRFLDKGTAALTSPRALCDFIPSANM